MLKKLLITASLIFSGIILLNAQCIPDSTVVAPGIYPDTATNLPDAYATLQYFATMTAVIPKDTLYMGITLHIDSIGISGITGLPAGFIYTPNRPTGNWPGWPNGSKGCILISGTASHAQVGTYPIIINTTAWASLGGLQQIQNNAVTGYRIVIKDTTLGISENLSHEGITFINNPDDNSVLIKIHSGYDIKNASIIVYDITGRELMHLNNLNGKDFLVSRGTISNGIYIVSLIGQEGIIAKQKVVIR